MSLGPSSQHAFLRRANGLIATINYPKAKNAAAYSINDNAVITGSYLDSNRVQHGFVRTP